MGVSTPLRLDTAPQPSRHVRWLQRWLPRWWQTAQALRRLALASVVANVVIVVTGGAVRLTDSGLGCPTWPSCTDASLTPTKAYAIHGVIEFTNRQLTFVLAIIAVATWLAAMARRQERTLATVAALSIPAQAVLGGLTVLTHLNPWLVAAHFLFSMSIIAVTYWLWWRLRAIPTVPPVHAMPPVARQLAWVTTAVAAAVLAIGTVVTGSGPHAGDKDASGMVHRTGLKVASMAQLHADVVMVLIGLSVGLLALVYAVRAAEVVRRAAIVLVAVELAQGVIGFAQYFLDVPPLLVALHMLGACLVWLAALRLLLLVAAPASIGVDVGVHEPEPSGRAALDVERHAGHDGQVAGDVALAEPLASHAAMGQVIECEPSGSHCISAVRARCREIIRNIGVSDKPIAG